MEQARAAALAIGNRRGLLNSSMSAEAGTKAAYDTVVPLASQDATTAGQRNLQELDRRGQLERLTVNARNEMDQIRLSGSLEQERVRVQGQVEAALSKQGAEQQQALATLQGSLASKLQSQQDTAAQARLDNELANRLKVQESENAARMAEIAASGEQQMKAIITSAEAERERLTMSIASNDRDKMAASITQILGYEVSLRAALQSNPNMPAAERAAYEAQIASIADPARAYVNQLYGGTVA